MAPADRPAFARRWAAAFVVVAAAGAHFAWYVVAPPLDPRLVIRSDGAGYHVWTHAILKGDPTFGWYKGDPEVVSFHPLTPGERQYTCKYPPGVALVRLPVTAWFAGDGVPPFSLGENFAVLALGGVALVGAVVLMLLACREAGAPPGWSNVAVLVLTFGTGLFHYATFDASFSHVYTALGVAFLAWRGMVAVHAEDRGGVPFGVFAAAAVLVLIRATNVVLLALWAAGLLAAKRVRPAFAAALGGGLGLAALVALNSVTFGRPTLNTYPGESFLWDRPMMLSVLISWHQGLLPYYPVLAAAVAVGLLARASRPAAVWFLGLVLAYAALYGYWWSWHLGIGFGHRGFVDLVPFAAPVLAVGLSRLPPRIARAAAALGAVLTAYTVVQMVRYWCFWLCPPPG